MYLSIYSVSIAFQIAGALLLMFFSISTKREKIIIRFKNKNDILRDNNTNRIQYDENEFRNTFRQAYLTKFSFSYIAFGYFIGIFGKIENANKFILALNILILTIFFMIVAYFIVEQIMKYSKNINRTITNDELTQFHIEPTAETLSDKEIDEIFEKE